MVQGPRVCGHPGVLREGWSEDARQEGHQPQPRTVGQTEGQLAPHRQKGQGRGREVNTQTEQDRREQTEERRREENRREVCS